MKAHAADFPAGVPYVSTAKGIYVPKHQMMNEAITEALGDRAKEIPLAYLSGPSFAKEMMSGHVMGVVVASADITIAKKVQKVYSAVQYSIVLYFIIILLGYAMLAAAAANPFSPCVDALAHSFI